VSASANYELVRDEVLRMRDEPKGGDTLFDASPSIAESLRQHSFQAGGAGPDEYRLHDDERRGRFEAKLRTLAELEGDALLVPEAPALGGFGYEIDGALYNSDTLKFFEALVALERGAVLDEIRVPGRRLVWEISAGWGGFAYQFKTLFPEVTYVIIDRPELFLFSATYLMTLFPGAKVQFHGDGDSPPDLEDVDFAFVPAGVSGPLRGGRPDLVFKAEQLDGYARLAWELGCRFTYSFNSDKVRQGLSRYYWLHEVPLLELETPPLAERLRSVVAPDSSSDCRHVVGWRRAST
jgi:hypothetical protein